MTHIITIALVTFTTLSEINFPYLFHHYQNQFSKNYSIDDYEMRFNIFKDNVEFIFNENMKDNNYTLGFNHFTDLAGYSISYERMLDPGYSLNVAQFSYKLNASIISNKNKAVFTTINSQSFFDEDAYIFEGYNILPELKYYFTWNAPMGFYINVFGSYTNYVRNYTNILVSNEVFEEKRYENIGRGIGGGFHDNGQLRYEGSFIDDNPSGIFLYYSDRGILEANLEYFNEGKSASAYLYYANGKVQAVGLYQNELKAQLWKYYDIKENLLREENYENGKLEGMTTLYYPDGNILEKSSYLADKKDGKSLHYHRNGQLKLSANYKADKLEGSYTFYNSSGVKKYSGKYLNDIKDGIWKYYKDDKSFAVDVFL